MDRIAHIRGKRLWGGLSWTAIVGLIAVSGSAIDARAQSGSDLAGGVAGQGELLGAPAQSDPTARPLVPGGAPIAIEIAPPSEEGRAAAYARRYRIAPELALKIVTTALAEGVDPELAFRLVRVESVFRTNARSPGGALGLTQLMPSTARAVDRSLRTEAQILEPEANLRTGFRYLRRMIERYKGDVRLGVLAYNRGQTAVDRALRAGRDPENGYSGKVLGRADGRYSGSGLVERR